jgi:hypothetical protein
MFKRGPLTSKEHQQRVEAARAPRHRAETAPSVRQGSTGAPSPRAVGLFRQGQSRPAGGGRGLWDTRTTEAPVGSMNATAIFHFPRAYRSDTPDRPSQGRPILAVALGARPDQHRDMVIQNPKAIEEALRHPEMRRIMSRVVELVRDHQKGTIERGIQRKMIPEGTRPSTVARAYKHAALMAIHKAGLLDYDTKMDDAAKAEFEPLRRFMLFAHRRVFDQINAHPDLKGKWAPFRDEFGQLFRGKKFGQYTGKTRMRMRPRNEFIKVADPGEAFEALAKAVGAEHAHGASLGMPGHGRGRPGSARLGMARRGEARPGAARQGGRPAQGAPTPLRLAMRALLAYRSGRAIPEPPAGDPPPPHHHHSVKHAAHHVERHLGHPIGGSTAKRPDGLYEAKRPAKPPPRDLAKYSFDADPNRQLTRAMRTRTRVRRYRLPLNPQRRLRRLIAGGITRKDRWLLGASTRPFDNDYLLGKAALKKGLIADTARFGARFAMRHKYATGLGAGLGAAVGVPVAAEAWNRHPVVRSIAGAAAAGGAAALLSRGHALNAIRRSSAKIYNAGIEVALREHARVHAGGTPGPLMAQHARETFRAAKLSALHQAQSARKAGIAGIRVPRGRVKAAAIAGGAAAYATRRHFTPSSERELERADQET